MRPPVKRRLRRFRFYAMVMVGIAVAMFMICAMGAYYVSYGFQWVF